VAHPSSPAKVLRWAIPLAALLGILLLFRHGRNADRGATGEKTWVATGHSGTDLGSFTEQMQSSLGRLDGNPVELQGVSFDSSGGLSGDSSTKLSALGKLLNNNPDAKLAITTYGGSTEQAASKANTIKSAITSTGVSAERISTQPEVGNGWPKVSFSK
jgi:hypothetical protein